MPKNRKINSIRKTNVNQHFSVETFSDIRKTMSDYNKARELHHSETNFIDSSNTDLGKKHTFRIPKSEGIVSDYYLELQIPVIGGALDIGDGAGFNFIQEVEFRATSELMKYNGRTLAQYLYYVNDDVDKRASLQNAVEDAGGDIDGRLLLIPLVFIGQHGIFGKANEGFDVHHLSSDLVVNVTLKTAAGVDVNGNVTLDRVRLRYRHHQVEEIDQTPNKSSIPFRRDYVFFHLNELSLSDSLTANTEKRFDIDSLVESSEMIALLVAGITDADRDTNLEFQRYTAIDQLKLIISNNDFYIHESQKDADMQHLQYFETRAQINLAGTQRQFYVIPLSETPKMVDDFGATGVDLHQLKPTVGITQPLTDTLDYNFVAVSKAIYRISPTGVMTRYYSPDEIANL